MKRSVAGVLGALAVAVVAGQAWAAGRHSVTIVVDATKSDGRAWDAFGGQPDIAICYTGSSGKTCIPGGGSNVTPGVPAACQDTLTCTLEIDLRGSDTTIEVIDVDMAANDAIGAGRCAVGSTCRLGSASVTIR